MITRPMPSMPVELWGDADGSLYRSSYFELFPGVWRQGDWIRFSERGSCVVTGRSDATLNRGGVRLGTGEFYSVVEELPEITDSLVVHLEDDEGGAGRARALRRARRRHALDDELRTQHRPRPALAAVAAPRARHDPRRARDPPHADGQEARDAGQAHPPRRAGRRRREQGLAPRPDGARHCSPRSRRRRAAVAEHDASRSRTSSRSTSTRTSRCRRPEATRSPTSCATPPCATSAASRRGRRRWSSRSYYRERKMMAVVFTVDSESFTGQTRVPNEEIAEVARANADVLIPFASIDPHKGRRGVDEARRLIAEHGVRGFKFHPNVQGFFPNDRMAYPLYEVIEEAGLPALFHTGQSGVGSGLPGGGGVRLKYSNPMHVDDVAVDFPTLKIVLAHPSFPWQDEAIADRGAQAAGLHRPLRMVAEVLPAAARPPREHAAARARAVRQRLPVHHSRPLARRLRGPGHQARGAAADPEAERHPPARAGGQRERQASRRRLRRQRLLGAA